MFTSLHGLRCTNEDCGARFSDDLRLLRCEKCGDYLEAEYALDAARDSLTRQTLAGRVFNQWRYHEVLPIREEKSIVSLHEGGTPLTRSLRLGEQMGLKNLFFKDESRNPTGSFKDRGASVTLSKCREIGAGPVVISSSGNAGASFAAYSAVAQHEAFIFLRPNCGDVITVQTAMYGKTTFSTTGTIPQQGALIAELSQQRGWFHTGVPLNLYRVEGKKTEAYEIVEQLGWRAPDRIVCPTGGGTNIIALHKGFLELEAMQWIDRRPKLVAIQRAECAPIAKAFKTASEMVPWAASSPPVSHECGDDIVIKAPNPAGGPAVLKAIDATDGVVEDVTEAEVIEAERLLAETEGIYVQAATAAGIAGLIKLSDAGLIDREELIVCINTGSGKNNPPNMRRASTAPVCIEPTVEAFDRATQGL